MLYIIYIFYIYISKGKKPSFYQSERNMKYSIDKQEKYSILALDEEKLDTLIAPKLKSEFVTIFQSGTSNLILDMSKVKYVDSSGLSAILVANRLAGDEDGFLVLAGITAHVMKLITISKLDNVLNLLPTVKEAIDAIFLSEAEKKLSQQSDIEGN
jgi:anti-sigma B factor antagonist